MAYPSRKRKSATSSATPARGMKRQFKRAKRELFPATKTAKAKKMKSRLTAMLQGQTKESSLAAVVPDTTLAVGTVSRCLTAMGSAAGTATSGNGVVVTDEDSALIDAYHYKGTYIGNWACQLADGSSGEGVGFTIRHLYVWWNRSIELASSAGTLPSLANVLQEISAGVYGPNCHFLAKNVTDKRFTVLADYTHYFDSIRGPVVKHFDEYVKINKIQKYIAPATEALAGGHFDSDQLAGQVSTGLPVLYIICTENGAQAGSDVTALVTALSCKGRLIYTA